MKLFCKKTLLSSALIALGIGNLYAQSTNHNYVLTKEPLTSINDTAQLNGNPKFENISYFDGLGRPTVSITKPNTEKALATKVTYDGFGRTDKEYLPGVVNGINFPSTINYSNYPETDKVYAQKEYENSPLSRVLKQGAPGEIWKVEGNNNIKFQYQTNTSNEVLNFGVSLDNNYVPTLVLNNYYSAGSLYKTITIDENGQPIQEFKDKEGKIILKRINIESKADFPKNSNGDHDTYYVYDIYGNLTYVLPPQLVKSAGVSLSDYINHLPELGYQYQYDEKNRLVEKQLPGKGREFMVYDTQDRLVLYQDINMRNGTVNTTSENTTLSKGWTFTKYDKFGRILYTGYFKNTADRKAMEAALKNKTTPNNEVKSSTGFTNNGLRIYYTTNEFPKSSLIVHTVNYYDNYEFLELKPSDLNEQNLVQELDQKLKGIPIATYANILGTTSWNKNYTFYEDKYLRPVITTQLNYEGGKTETKTEYDSFRGKVLSTTTNHQLSLATDPIIIKERFEYNSDESIKYQTHQINDGSEEFIVRNEYNDIKQLVRKNIGNTSFDSSLEQVNYKFNIRGWLTDINDVNRNTDNLFAFKIKYHDSDKGDNPFNGNIGETLWKIENGNVNSYAYHYDGLNRLLLGKSTEVSNSIFSTNQYDERIVGYDYNGNIKGLSRNTENFSLSLNGIQQIDDLEYNYKPNSNQLESVNDLTSNEQGFNDKNTTGADYEYDLNGNLKKDLNKNITNIAYNHLNLPIEVLFNNDGELSKIQYLYDASGVKVSKFVNENLLIPYSENTYYDNGFQYKQSAVRGNNLSLQFFPTAEGYVNVNEGIFEYVYNYTDHLGNVRVSYTKGEDGNRKIVDENSYYPFGLKHSNQSIVNTTNPNYKYKYNGKELQEELNLNLYDYGARNYDPAIGRWMNVDPLAEKFQGRSPYEYCFNNPINLIDPTGMGPEDWVKDGDSWIWRSDITSKQQALDNGYSDYSDGVTNNTYTGDGGQQITLGQDRHWYKGGQEYTAPDHAPQSNAFLKFLGDFTGGSQAVNIHADAKALSTGSDGSMDWRGYAAYTLMQEKITNPGGLEVGRNLFGRSSAGVKAETNAAKGVFMPIDEAGQSLKVTKSKAGNIKIDGEARGRAHTQLRMDATGNYPQRNTFDAKGRRRSDTHFTTHGEANKSNPHKHTYYKNGRRSGGR